MKDKNFKQCYYGRVLKIELIDKSVIQGYCTGYNKDENCNITELILRINDSEEIKKIHLSNIKKIIVINSNEQYGKYEHAYNFYLASKRCLMNIPQEEMRYLIIPYMVNSAFACEIFLKALLDERKIRYGNSHELFKLFKKLPYEVKQYFVSQLKLEDFYKKLKKCSNVFENFSYLYENIYNSENIDMYFWNAFVEELYVYCNKNLKKGTNIVIEM